MALHLWLFRCIYKNHRLSDGMAVAEPITVTSTMGPWALVPVLILCRGLKRYGTDTVAVLIPCTYQ